VAQAYKSLWQVERVFREIKSGLDLRPVYHWTEKRIRGHVMICFLALVLEMALRRKLLERTCPTMTCSPTSPNSRRRSYTSTAGAASPGRSLPVRPTSLSARSV
jgi:transposase